MITICITVIICIIVICVSYCYISYLKIVNNPILFESDNEVNDAKIRNAYQMTLLFKERYILPFNDKNDIAYQGGTREINTFLDNLINILK